jgi:hypothetical protein
LQDFAELFKIALTLRNDLKPLDKSEIAKIKAKAAEGSPIFKYDGKT